jgi:type I restriction enzyme M protein
MAKVFDVPTELREFNKVFERVGGYKWDCGVVFEDLLDFMIACLSLDGDKELAERMQKKYGKDYHYFSEMMAALMKAYDVGLKRREWYDGLGEFYEAIASHSKASRLGQFFTPASVVDMMALMLKLEGEEITDKTVNDCCSGSGRLLIAHHVYHAGNRYFGGDIDSICAKMTAFNMCIHGVRGQAICGDGLFLHEKWWFGFEINRHLVFGIPSIEKINQGQCFQSRMFDKVLVELKADKVIDLEAMKEEEIKQKLAKRMAKTGQIGLF